MPLAASLCADPRAVNVKLRLSLNQLPPSSNVKWNTTPMLRPFPRDSFFPILAITKPVKTMDAHTTSGEEGLWHDQDASRSMIF